MSKIKKFYDINKTALLIAAILSVINVLLIFPFGLQTFTYENLVLTELHIIFSAGIFILHIALCIFMQIKRYSKLAKGIFYYQLIGFISYALYFFFFIFNVVGQNVLYTIFHSWTVYLEPLAVFLGRIGGIKAKYIVALFYLFSTFITGKTIIAIRKNISYEKQYKEDHSMEV